MPFWPSRPLTVILDITERCNLKCRMCHFSVVDQLHFPPVDLSLSPSGMMPLDVFETIAEELFPRAWRVALACSAEPLIHPRFDDIVRIAGRYRVRHLWFPTNLLPLTEKKARAICESKVAVVGVSIDGFEKETYENIRVGGSWERLTAALELFNEIRRGSGVKLRFIFTWMRSNRHQLRLLPEFARRWRAQEVDVRFVTPTAGVDVRGELLDEEDPALLQGELRTTARKLVSDGVKLAYYPRLDDENGVPTNPIAKLRRHLWRLRAGIERPEFWRYRWDERRQACSWPSRFLVIRPNGAVSPCIFWQGDPIGLVPRDTLQTLEEGKGLRDILDGLRSGNPIGTCQQCSERRHAFHNRLAWLSALKGRTS